MPMAELVATMAIKPLVSMLKDKASSYLLDQYKVMEGMEEQHKILKRKLPAILDVITDAEEQATAHREGVKAWLEELKTVAYEANDVFDEFRYEALRREAKEKGHYRKLGFDVIKLLPTHNRVVFRYNMSTKLCRILQAIEVLIAEMHAFRFSYRSHPPLSKKWRQTDYVIIDPQEISSRSKHEDRKNIVDILLGQASNADLTVVPIVGVGGLGKTTLAQLIYNEPEIQKHFQLLLWVSVSDSFDVNSLANLIVETAAKKGHDTDKPPLDNLKKVVSGQRCLLVLDDVWNREVHKWEKLKVCLQHGGIGSAVLTTTRDKQVAEIMGADRAYHLNELEGSFLKEIIEARAFNSGKEKPAVLVKMVDEIVKRCYGSPLAAIALGSVLRTKTSVEEWKAVSCRSSICTEETGILPILKLSYNDLPSHMKQCFAFCAVFPKDYKIDVEKLIQLWIANGFILEQKEDSLETIGKHIFYELASRSFFLDIEEFKLHNGEYYSKSTCKIHDLMHDIAMSVMEKECVVATKKSSQTEWLPDTTRHLFLSSEGTKGLLDDTMEHRSPAIQTLLCDSFMRSPLQHQSKYSSLHALRLCIQRESFLPKPKYLHHLRYLGLSKSHMKELPEDITVLYNLQMLDLSKCLLLDRLPMHMKYMTSLRHLCTHGCPELRSMPPELGKLTKLQTLTCFVAAVGPDCSDVAELQHLKLGGQLQLCQLENVIEAEAKVSNLGNKKDLRELTLSWTSNCDSKVLNNFEPHDGLKVLRIVSYGGKCLGMLQNMVEINLFHCERLQILFRGGTSFTFPNLKELTLEHLLDFERWWVENKREEEQVIFPLLEKLFIRHCGKLVALPESQLFQELCGGGCRFVRSPFPALKILEMTDLETFQRWDTVEVEHVLFPCLEKLSIQRCPKLIALPEAPLLEEPCSGGGYRLVRSAFPALKVLEMNDLERFQRWDAVKGEQILFPGLEKLSIQRCPKLIALPKAPLLQEPCNGGDYSLVRSAFPTLKVFEMNDLERFRILDAVKGEHLLFPRLEKLSIQRCPKLIALPEASVPQEPWSGGGYRLVRSALPALKVLELEDLESFRRWDAVKETQGEQILFPCLEKLSIQECPKVIDLPKAPKLSILEIEDGKQQIFRWVHRYIPSLTKLILKLENTKITSEVEYNLIEPVNNKERWNQKSPLTVMQLWYCNSFFGSGALEQWDYFVHLEELEINRCDVLVNWPEKVFESLESLRRLAIISCRSLTGYAQAPLALSTSELRQHLPALQFLVLQDCESLVEMFNVPASLKRMSITMCVKLECIFGKQQGMPVLVEGSSCSGLIASTASSPMNHFCPCLEYLSLFGCDSLSAVLNLPPSIKTITIGHCSNIQVLSCQLDELRKPQVTTSINVLEPSAEAREHSLPPCLESLTILSCTSIFGILNLPRTLKDLSIEDNSMLTSLESLSGDPPSLESLCLDNCRTLAFLPNEPQAYGSLRLLRIKRCPAIKKLPRCLRQQLGNISRRQLDAHYEVMEFSPKKTSP